MTDINAKKLFDLTDRVAIDLSATEITQQKISEKEGPKTATKPGNFSNLTLDEPALTPRSASIGKAKRQ